MDLKMKRRVEEKVREILGKADMDTVTGQKVREMAAERIGIDLSDIDSKKLISKVVDAFLLSTFDDDERARVNDQGLETKENTNANLVEEGNPRVLESNSNLNGERKDPDEQPPEASERAVAGEVPANKIDRIRFLCELSNKRSVAIEEKTEEKVVLVGEFVWKDGKRVPGNRGISLTAQQWIAFRKSFPDIEEAIKKVKSRSELEQKQIEGDDKSDPNEPELKKPKIAVASTPNKLNPIEIIRFDGKNYHDWARRMELFLKQTNLAYVLTDKVADSTQNWMNDDYMCRTNILNSLSDNLFHKYSKKAGSAKDFWNDLKLVYLTEEHGSKVSLVKKYMEFQMVEGKSVVAQTQELHELADSLDPHGMHVQECFHVNSIISKLPASWKDVGVKLMMEKNLPVWMLMNSLKQEEELRSRGQRGASPSVTAADDSEPHSRRVLHSSLVSDRERKVLFCTICKKRGHLEEKCWFKNGKYERGQNSNVVVAESKEGVPKEVQGSLL